MTPRRLPAATSFAIAGVCAGGALAVVTFSSTVTSRHSLQLVMSVAALVVVVAGALALDRSLESDVEALALHRMVLMYSAVVFGLASIAWLEPQAGPAALIEKSSVPGSVALIAGGLLMFAWGARWSARHDVLGRPLRWLRTMAFQASSPVSLRFRGIAIALYSVGFVVRLKQILTGSYAYFADPTTAVTAPSSTGQIESLLEDFARYGIIIAALDAFALSRSFRARTTLFALLVIEIPFTLVSGVKGELVFTYVAVAIVYRFSTARWPWRSALVCLAALLILIPLNTAYRQLVRSDPATFQTPADVYHHWDDVAAQAFGSGRADTAEQPWVYFAQRFRLIDNVALIRQKTPAEIPYMGWTTLAANLSTAPVPRAVLPRKRVLSTGLEMSRDYYELPPSFETASAVTVPGDLYRYGGALALASGMFLYGAMARAVSRVFTPQDDLRNSVVFFGMFVLLMNLENDVVSLFAGSIQTLVTTVALTAVAFRRSPVLIRSRRAALVRSRS